MVARQSTVGEPLFAATRHDPRAERGRRDVSISHTHVTIKRRVGGVDMHLALALSAYRGVALCLAANRAEASVYQIRLVHDDAELTVLLEEATDDRNIIADWRLWARVLNLPALVEREVGRFEVAESTPDSCETEIALPRRHRPSKLRPQFLARRQVGVPAEDPIVHAGEREIIART